MKRTRNLKLSNGFGSPIFLGANRRKPYGARITTRWDEHGKQKYEYIGYGETWNDAYQLLCNYHKNPYNLEYKGIKFKEVFEKVQINLLREFENDMLSKSSYKCLMSAYNQNLHKLDDKNFVEIITKDVQNIIDRSGLKYTGRNYIKILFTIMVDYCNDELNLNINPNIYNKLDIGNKEKSNKHKPLITDHIHHIEEMAKTNDLAKMIMIYLYTGMRPSELLEIEISKVYLEEDYMIGGIKTDAGIDRIIPIHSEIKRYIQYFYDSNNQYLIINKNTGKKMNYDYLKKKFKNFMELLGYDYLPHDPRHTFATKCAELKMPDRIIKLLLGHSLSGDVTNDVYIHVSKDILKEYIERIKY